MDYDDNRLKKKIRYQYDCPGGDGIAAPARPGHRYSCNQIRDIKNLYFCPVSVLNLRGVLALLRYRIVGGDMKFNRTLNETQNREDEKELVRVLRRDRVIFFPSPPAPTLPAKEKTKISKKKAQFPHNKASSCPDPEIKDRP